jgi:hypothetical protein
VAGAASSIRKSRRAAAVATFFRPKVAPHAMNFAALLLAVSLQEPVVATDALLALVPDGALIVAQSASPAALHEALLAHDFGRLLLAPDGLFVGLASELGGLPDGFDAAALAALFGALEPTEEQRAAAGPIFSALHETVRTSLAPLQMYVAPSADFSEAAAVFATHTGGSARAAVDRMLGLAEVTYSWKTLGGFELVLDENGFDDDEALLACREDLLVLVAGSNHRAMRREMKRLIDSTSASAAAGGGALAAPAAASPALAEARAALGATHHVRVFVDLTRVVAMFDEFVASEDSGATEQHVAGLRDLGVDRMRFAALGFTIGAGANFDVEGLLAFPTSGLLHDLARTFHTRTPATLLGMVPSEATSVQVAGVDLAEFAALLGGWFEEYAPDVAEMVLAEVEPFTAATGLDPFDELVAIFPGSFVTYTLPPKSDAPLPDESGSLVQFFDALGLSGSNLVLVNDTARLENLVTRSLAWFEELAGEPLPIDTFDIDGQIVRGMDTPDGGMWFGSKDGVLAFGQSAESVAADLLRERTTEPRFDARFVAAFAAAQDAMSMAAMDTRSMFELGGQAVRLFGELMEAEGEIDFPLGAAGERISDAAERTGGLVTSGYRLDGGVMRMFVRGR